MTVDPRAALDRLVAALEAHYSAIVNRRGDEDPAVDDFYYVLADAFDVYDKALEQVHHETTPFYLDLDDDDDDDADDEADDDDEDVDVDVDLGDDDIDDIDEDDEDEDEDGEDEDGEDEDGDETA